MKEEIINLIREKGLLLEKDIFDLLSGINDLNAARNLLENLEKSGQKIINKTTLTKSFEIVKNAVGNFPGEDRKYLENVFIKLGLSLEIKKESEIIEKKAREIKNLPGQSEKAEKHSDFKIFYAETRTDKKLEVADFIGNFRARYQSLQRILMRRPELTNLVSINKISSDRQSLSIIGIVTEKRMTKNKNLIIKVEDLTGEIPVIIKSENAEGFGVAEELLLDDIIGIRASGSREMLFAHRIYYPDSFKFEKVKFEEDANIIFMSDLHCGSDVHLEKSLNKFIEWINSDDENARKTKYIFFTGDNVDGVGVYPGQENNLILKSMEEQYEKLASYLKKIPKHITMFMCPGQHDATRIAVPQPIISKRYASAIYEIENLILVTNPTLVKLIEKEKELSVLMYHGASLSPLIAEVKELRIIKAHKCPARAVKHLLKRRHLAPTHSTVTYIPNADRDPLVIDEVPDIIATGDLHRPDIEMYNGVLIVTGSCWEAQTDFMEKTGNIPDPGKISVYNLKNRQIKVYDFLDENEKKEFGIV